jgi:hypothetical protein
MFKAVWCEPRSVELISNDTKLTERLDAVSVTTTVSKQTLRGNRRRGRSTGRGGRLGL